MISRIDCRRVPGAAVASVARWLATVALVAVLGCSAGRVKQEPPPPPPEATVAVIGGGVGHYMDRQAAELVRIEGARTARFEDEIRVTWDSAVLFDFDSAMLRVDSQTDIREMVAVLAKYPDTDIVIAGHTDSEGPDEYNQKLSERRAMSLRNCLVDMGVAPSRLTAIGYGELRPVSSDAGEDGRRMNRRVEIEIRANAELRARAAE